MCGTVEYPLYIFTNENYKIELKVDIKYALSLILIMDCLRNKGHVTSQLTQHSYENPGFADFKPSWTKINLQFTWVKGENLVAGNK